MTSNETKYCSDTAQALGVPPIVVETWVSRLSSGGTSSAFAARLAALDVEVPEGFEPKLCSDLIEAGLDPETLAAVLTTCRAFPISDGTRTFAEFAAEAGLIYTNEVEEVLLESVAQGRSTIEHLIEVKKLKTNALLDALAEFSGTPVASRSELIGDVADVPNTIWRTSLRRAVRLWIREKGGNYHLFAGKGVAHAHAIILTCPASQKQ